MPLMDLTYDLCFVFQNSPFFQKYELDVKGPPLGDGAFSVCRKCRNMQTNQMFAVKIVSRRLNCNREVQLLNHCQGHPNIVNLVDVMYDEVCSVFLVLFLLHFLLLLLRWLLKLSLPLAQCILNSRKFSSTSSHPFLFYVHLFLIINKVLYEMG